MRRLIQALSLLLFSLFLFFATYQLPNWFPADLYLRLDPLLGLTSVIAARELIGRALWGLIILGATLVVGRFFCGYVCPLGVSIDFLDVLLFSKTKRPGLQKKSGLGNIKIALLVIFIAASAAGFSLAFLMDPIPLLTRFYSFFLYPLAVMATNLFLDAIRPLSQKLGWIGLAHLHYPQPVYFMSGLTLLVFGGIIALNRIVPRFWCRYLCPLGAFLSLISPLGLFKRRVNKDCNDCLKCKKNCPMDAIGDDPRKTRLAECIQCRTCANVCPQKAIAFPPAFSRGGEADPVNFSRRGFVYSLAGGLGAGFLAIQSPFTLREGKQQIIRPPGAIPESDFLRTCIRCGECMKSCLTNTLQPSLWESGLSGLWTPRLDLRMAGCEQNCNVCGKVCPTQAIRSLSLEEKTHAKIGTAVIRKETCLVWAQNKLCLICDEICPYNAIVFRPVEGYRRPVVVASKCNGCGYCEQRCPVRGESAIAVVPNGEIRLKEGSYVKEAKKLELEFKPDAGDDKFILEESGFNVDQEKKEEKNPSPKTAPQPQKPKGFL